MQKTAGTDTIPPQLEKITLSFLAPHLLNTVNISMHQNSFPENAKVVSVVLLNENKPMKNTMKP